METMGLFRVIGRLTGPTGISEDVELLVDTDATLLVVLTHWPRDWSWPRGALKPS